MKEDEYMKAYKFEVYADRLIAMGVCSDASGVEVERWVNASRKRSWRVDPEAKFSYERQLDTAPDPTDETGKRVIPIPGMPPKSGIPCPDGREGHQHFILRSGMTTP